MKTGLRKVKGFTLIELLVVVLIIGVLAAIALPQYHLAVEKSRVNALLPVLKSIDSAQKIYFLNNGIYTISFSDLEISMPPGGTLTTSGTSESINYSKYRCLLRYGTANIPSSYSSYCFTPRGTSIEKYYDRSVFLCWAAQTDELQNRICKTVSEQGTYTAVSGYNVYYAF